MQDEINEKTIALYIKTGKLTAQTLQKAMKKLLAEMSRQKSKTPHGKQTLKQLMKQNAGVSNIEVIFSVQYPANKYHTRKLNILIFCHKTAIHSRKKIMCEYGVQTEKRLII